MYAPRVFVSMIGALAVFAVGTYLLTQSLSTTLIQTAICAVLIQIGYFGGVLYLVWKQARVRDANRQPQAPAASGTDRHEEIKTSGLNRSEPFNP